jgi:hypothetical protein
LRLRANFEGADDRYSFTVAGLTAAIPFDPNKGASNFCSLVGIASKLVLDNAISRMSSEMRALCCNTIARDAMIELLGVPLEEPVGQLPFVWNRKVWFLLGGFNLEGNLPIFEVIAGLAGTYLAKRTVQTVDVVGTAAEVQTLLFIDETGLQGRRILQSAGKTLSWLVAASLVVIFFVVLHLCAGCAKRWWPNKKVESLKAGYNLEGNMGDLASSRAADLVAVVLAQHKVPSSTRRKRTDKDGPDKRSEAGSGSNIMRADFLQHCVDGQERALEAVPPPPALPGVVANFLASSVGLSGYIAKAAASMAPVPIPIHTPRAESPPHPEAKQAAVRWMRVPERCPVEFYAFPECWGQLLSMIRMSRVWLWITMYTGDSPQILDAIHMALAAGCRTRILVESTKIDASHKQKAMLSALHTMKATAPLDKDQLQVRVFQPQRRHTKDGKESWPAALHAKMGVSDNLIAWVGSQNLTENSQTYYEAISVVRYPAAVQKQLDTIQAWWELGIEFDPGLPQLLGARATKLLGARTVTTSRSGHGTKHRDPSAS